MNTMKKNSFEVAYEEALQLACSTLLAKDIAACCAAAGAELHASDESSRTISLEFLNKTVRISLPEFTFSLPADGEVHIWEKILILHYLANSTKTGLSDAMINYRQVRDGAPYYSTFKKRCMVPLLKMFGAAAEKLPPAAAPFGGEPVALGDVGVKIPAFPHVPIIYSIWKGDDEFPPSANILFDASIDGLLSAEDIAVLCQQIVFKLIKNANA